MKMKKKLVAAVLAMVLVFSLLPAVAVNANEIPVRVTIDGQEVRFAGQGPVVISGSTFVPVRGVFELLGFTVEWDGANQQATLMSDSHVVVLTIGSNTFTTNGINQNLGAPVRLIGGSTMLPLRAVIESIGHSVSWDGAAQTVLITTAVPPPAQEPTPTPPPANEEPGYPEEADEPVEPAALLPSDVTVGDIIQFGGYDWRVLEVRNNQALLLSEYVLFNRAFGSGHWPNSDIRYYLNNDFLGRFNPQDQARIASTTLPPAVNRWVGRGSHGGATDRIFLLSIEDVVRYFGDSGRFANPGPHVGAPNGPPLPREAFMITDEFNEARIAWDLQGSATRWWLRTQGTWTSDAIYVCDIGTVYMRGVSVNGLAGIRPALWLNL